MQDDNDSIGNDLKDRGVPLTITTAPMPPPLASTPSPGRRRRTGSSPSYQHQQQQQLHQQQQRMAMSSRPTTTSYVDLPASSRRRIASADIPRTYSGLYGQGESDDEEGCVDGGLLPFALARNRNTDWLPSSSAGQGEQDETAAMTLQSVDKGKPPSSYFLFVTYLLVIGVGHWALSLVLPFRWVFTVTNILHGFTTLTYLHWIKGSPDFYEPGGELNAMTLWEQMICSPTPPSEGTIAVLYMVPTVLTYAACQMAQYKPLWLILVNIIMWFSCIVAKMPFMNGVRLLGINRTAGIDDDTRKAR